MADVSTVRICRKCLLREFDEQEYMEKLHQYIVSMDKDIKADEELYGKRLAVCKECEKLMQGTCMACGCYVELRAAVRKSHCPYKRW